MITHVSTERMHEALDGALTSAELDELERHFETCDACRNEYARMSEVVGAVRALPRSAGAPDGTWEAIRARIESVDQDGEGSEAVVLELPTGRDRAMSSEAESEEDGATLAATSAESGGAPLYQRGVRMSIPQLAAAATIVAFLSAGAMRMVMENSGVTGPTSVAAEAEVVDEPGGAAARAVSLEQARYSEMIDQLEQVLEEGRSVLAPETLVSIDEALRTVDEAISEIETALAEDPNSDLLLRLLTTHQNTKLGVLQRAAGAVQSQT